MAEIFGTPGNDTIDGTEGADVINGGGGRDVVSGAGGNDTINGGDGDDALLGGDGDDTLNGDAGNDAVRGGRGADVMDGGTGTNILNYVTSSAGVTINLSTGEARGGDAEGDRFTRFQNIDATFHNDVLTGDNGANVLDGYSGSDILYGLGGNDTLFADNYFGISTIPPVGSQLYGGDGDDQLFVTAVITGTGAILDGGAGNDTFTIDFNTAASGFATPTVIERPGEGNDTVRLLLQSGTNTFIIPDNIETVIVLARSNSVVPEVWTIIGNDQANTILSSENAGLFYGNGGDDSISGGSGNDLIDGGSGNDSLSAGNGNDTIVGGTGNDFLSGDSGTDSLDGGDGNDYLNGASSTFVSGSFVADVNDIDTLIGGLGDDTYVIDSRNDIIIENAGEGVDTVVASLPSGSYTLTDTIENLRIASPNGISALEIAYGNSFGNQINGSEQANIIYGLGGNDVIFGFGGNDTLDGGSGDDSLFASAGNDALYGGDGNDRLDGTHTIFVNGQPQPALDETDTLAGGAGDDLYFIDSANDVITENANEGGDIVILGVAGGVFVLANNVEGLTVSRIINSTATVTVYGNAIANTFNGSQESDAFYGLGGDDTINGFGGSDVLVGGAGNDTLIGESGIDTAVVSGLRSAYTVTQTTTGVFQVTGADGTDTLNSIEFLRFDDQTIRLLRGTGVSVNFNTADRSVYQTAMNAIRDFDGNALGGNGSWLRIGQADVNGDGDIDQILVNRAIGRFATVGTAPDGLVYFLDNGWAGETRVAGIYIDPLVAAGAVVSGSPNDSQRRFQNDLQIENINRVLGADDYDNDGLQEVYFALTDGTAYLRALMETDGNIRYANYQSQREVIDYLTANGFGPDTWAGWFTRSGSGEAGLGGEDGSGLGRAGLAGLLVADDIALPGALALNSQALHQLQPDAITAEFYG